MSADAVPAAPLSAWLRAEVPEVKVGDGPVAVERISGGHSNLTYRITDAAGTPFALRRPPLGMVLATAHDMGREWRFISALAPFGVPVAPPVVFCQTPTSSGRSSTSCASSTGEVLGDAESGHRLAEGESRTTAGLDTADVLAALHAVDPDEAGLSRPASRRLLHRAAAAPLAPSGARLVADRPGDRRRRARAARRPRATLPPSDVRIAPRRLPARQPRLRPRRAASARSSTGSSATLGDPLADLGWLMASWGRPADTAPPTIEGPNQVGGYPDGDALVARYAERSRPRRRRPGLLRGVRAVARGVHPGRGATAATRAARSARGRARRPRTGSRGCTCRPRPPTTRSPDAL